MSLRVFDLHRYSHVRHQDEEVHPDKNPVVKFFRRFMPVTTGLKRISSSFAMLGRLMQRSLSDLADCRSTDLCFCGRFDP